MQLSRTGECTLRVNQPSHGDIGRYSCCATNIIGRDVCQADVSLQGAELVDNTSYISKEAMEKINLVARLYTAQSYAACDCVFAIMFIYIL